MLFRSTVYVMPLGSENCEPVVTALDRHKKFLRGEIARKINMKFAPDIRFKVDTSFENSAKIDALLNSEKVRRDIESAPKA